MTREVAINLVKQVLPCLNIDEKIREGFETLIPELRESEDEKIRRQLINVCNDWLNGDYSARPCLNDIKWLKNLLEKQKEQKPEIISISEMVSKYRSTDEYDDGNYKGKPANCMIRAYEQGIRDTLLKLKEQKPAEWSENDKKGLDNCCAIIAMPDIFFDKIIRQKCLDFLYELPERFNLQPKQEWNEEDEKLLNKVESMMDSYRDFWRQIEATNPEVREIISQPKSLRPQPKQELSEEDIANGWTGVNLERYLSCLQRLGTGNPQQPETINSKWFKEHCRPLPKQEWSEEDENNLNKLLQWNGIPLGLRNWVSGLPEKVGTRPSWKPSEEQMEALECAERWYSDNMGHNPVFYQLLCDLKKL